MPAANYPVLSGFLSLFLLIPWGGTAQYLGGGRPPVVSILQPSRIYVEGKSNVNSFSCDCDQDFAVVRPNGRWETGTPALVFSNTRLRLRTENLDCGNRTMNRDLRNTLRADRHPEIGLELKRIRFPGARSAVGIGPDWTSVTVHASLEMAGKTRPATIEFSVRTVGHEVYELVGVHEVRMTDFDIEPPTALLGLVKVKDRMRIHFKLWISVRQPASGVETEK